MPAARSRPTPAAPRLRTLAASLLLGLCLAGTAAADVPREPRPGCGRCSATGSRTYRSAMSGALLLLLGIGAVTLLERRRKR